jgi:hypothetical protein
MQTDGDVPTFSWESDSAATKWIDPLMDGASSPGYSDLAERHP